MNETCIECHHATPHNRRHPDGTGRLCMEYIPSKNPKPEDRDNADHGCLCSEEDRTIAALRARVVELERECERLKAPDFEDFVAMTRQWLTHYPANTVVCNAVGDTGAKFAYAIRDAVEDLDDTRPSLVQADDVAELNRHASIGAAVERLSVRHDVTIRTGSDDGVEVELVGTIYPDPNRYNADTLLGALAAAVKGSPET